MNAKELKGFVAANAQFGIGPHQYFATNLIHSFY